MEGVIVRTGGPAIPAEDLPPEVHRPSHRRASVRTPVVTALRDRPPPRLVIAATAPHEE